MVQFYSCFFVLAISHLCGAKTHPHRRSSSESPPSLVRNPRRALRPAVTTTVTAPWWDDDEAVGDAGDVEVLPSVTVGFSCHCPFSRCDIRYILLGGRPTPLKNMKVKWSIIPNNYMENKRCSKPPTSIRYIRYQAISRLDVISHLRRSTGTKPGCPYYCWVPQKGSVQSGS